jgi:hypothetical protein
MLPRHSLSLTCLAAVALAPLPAMAADTVDHQDIARRLSDPGAQVAATVALSALVESLLDMKIEPIRRAMAAAGDHAAQDMPRNARLRDLAGPEAERLPGEIGHHVPQAMGAAAGMAGAVEEMLPEINATVDRLRNALPKE